MSDKQQCRLYIVLSFLIAPSAVWAQSALIEESAVPVEGEIREVIPCPEAAQSDCLAGVVSVEEGKEPEFKVIDNAGKIKWKRPAKRFREGWIKGNRETVVVEHDESGKGFIARRFDADGKEISQIEFEANGRDPEEFDYNAAGNGEMFAPDMDKVIYANGKTRQRPQEWKKSVLTPLYWYLLPDGSIVVSSGRSREGGKEESARITIEGEIKWRYPGSLMLSNHVKRRAARVPKYLLAWGPEKKSLSLVNTETGELHWKLAESKDAFGINLIRASPSERYFVLSISKGRPNIEIVVADAREKRISGAKKLPEGLEDVRFDPDETQIFAVRKAWQRKEHKRDVIRGKKVRAKLRAEKWGLDLKDKATAFETDVDAASIKTDKLLPLPNGRAILVDPHSKRLRIIKHRE